MVDTIGNLEDPCQHGKPLKHDKRGFWRYRHKDHRIICSIEKSKLVILVLKVGHRKNVYR